MVSSVGVTYESQPMYYRNCEPILQNVREEQG